MTQSGRAQLIASMALLVAGVCTSAEAQPRSARPQPPAPTQAPQRKPEMLQAAIAGGKVQGVVRDERGYAVGGVMISAVGTTTSAALSDSNGRFLLPLPSGEYVLRAHREGYASSFVDIIMVRSNSAIERTVSMTRRAAVSTPSRPVMMAGVGGVVTPVSSAINDTEHPHDEAAWRMRHLKRPVLRDVGTAVADAARSQHFRPKSSGFLDWAVTSSARLANSFFLDTDFTGQVNFLTTGAVDGADGWSPSAGAASVAYVSVSAPVGSIGDWRVRGAMNATDLGSWVVLGEFVGRDARTHAITAGMSYSAQSEGDAPATTLIKTPGVPGVPGTTRSVGGVYGGDRWRMADGFEVDYGLRWDRYSYVSNAPNMVSPRLAGRARMIGRTSVVAELEQRMVAPGSTEFLPPNEAGPWLPPERTFSSLSPSGRFRAERVRHGAFGVEQAFGRDGVVSLRKFRQTADDQGATIFGLSTTAPATGHYSVVSVGAAAIDGWSLRLGGSVSKRLAGHVEYTTGQADWMPGGGRLRAQMVAPSVVRSGRDRMQDVTSSVDVTIPESSTTVSLTYRINSQFSRAGLDATPGLGTRFGVQVNQALPFQPLRGGRLELLVAVSNLFRDGRQAGAMRQSGSMFDELLTVAPPLRLLGGVQIRF